MKRFLFSLLLWHTCFLTEAGIKLPNIFQDYMVLQQQKQNIIWGWAGASQNVTLTFLNKKYNTKADANGNWKITLIPAKAGDKTDIVITAGKETTTIHNVLIGEVWLCSGQSNMEFPMKFFKEFYKDEIAQSTDDNIRFTVVKTDFDNKERTDANIRTRWISVNPNTIEDCSAVAYFFAKTLRKKLGVPIGLVISSWGGTPAQAWIDGNTIRNFPAYATVYENGIKKIDFDKLEENKKAYEDVYRKEKIKMSEVFRSYTAIDYNDADWEKTSLPGAWENAGHPSLDGIAAYRISFSLSAEDLNKEAILHLPAIDDVDSTFINGVLVGTHNVWNEIRTYKIPGGVLKEGKNIISIWVEDTGGGGGLNDDPEHYYLQLNDKKMPLGGSANFKILLPLQMVGNGVNYNAIQNEPGVLFNAMISPLLNIKFAGVIWYQGESNVPNYIEYRTLFPALINCWRNRFNEKKLPFLFVQLSSFNPSGVEPVVSDWAGLREAQTYALNLPKTGMAVTIDIGDEKDIHPKRKKEVGERLAANALHKVYGFINEPFAGPIYSSSVIEGNAIKINYTHTGKLLMQKGETLAGFTIAGKDKHFVPAIAVINKNNVIVSSPSVAAPMYVRYAWANAPLNANLYNSDGLPAAPFRTDKEE